MSNTFIAEAARLRWGGTILLVLGAVAVASFVLAPQSGLLAVAVCAAVGLLMMASELFRGRIEGLLVCWVALFPLGSELTFPRERSIVNLERTIIFLGLVALLFAKRSTLAEIPQPLRRAGLACLAFISAAALTLGKSPDLLYAARYLVDTFLVPFCFAWAVIAWFDVRHRLPALHTTLCISSIFCASIAAAEMVTGQDLLSVPGARLDFAGDIARPNGPFASNDQLALIGGISLFLLLFLRAALGPKVSVGRRFLHSIGLAATVGMTLMPMFRSVMITILIVLIIDTFWESRLGRRTWRIALILSFAGLLFGAKVLFPGVFQDRSGTDNWYARIAEYKQSLKVFADHPVLGVGYSNFNYFVAGESQYTMTYNGVQSVDWPHSNLASALAETGILGFVPYIMMHVLLVVALWRLRGASDSGKFVWKYVFYMVLIYWMTGLTESAGFEPQLNVWYVFALAVCYKYALTTPDSHLAVDTQISEDELPVPARVNSQALYR